MIPYGTNPADARESIEKQIRALEAQRQLLAASQTPPAAPPSQPLPDIAKMVEVEVARQMANVKPPAPVKSQADRIKEGLLTILMASISKPNAEWLQKHMTEGAPGFAEFLNSEAIKEHIVLAFDGYKDFLEGKSK